MGWRIWRCPVWTVVGLRPSLAGSKARRGDVRAAILAVLAEQSMNGYQIIQEIATRSGGVWKPSPGSSIQLCSSSRTKVCAGRRRWRSTQLYLDDQGRLT